jgi:hypothetical protein
MLEEGLPQALVADDARRLLELSESLHLDGVHVGEELRQLFIQIAHGCLLRTPAAERILGHSWMATGLDPTRSSVLKLPCALHDHAAGR